jgi:hypothetical protein
VKVLIMQEHHVLPNLQGKNQSFQIQFFNQWLECKAMILSHLSHLHFLGQAKSLNKENS